MTEATPNTVLSWAVTGGTVFYIIALCYRLTQPLHRRDR